MSSMIGWSLGRTCMRRAGWDYFGVFILAVLCLLAGCSGGYRDRIQSADPASRVRAIIRAAEMSDQAAVPLIVDRLEDEDEAVRAMAIMALKKLTGQDLGYRAFDPLRQRTESAQRWRQWLKGGKIERPATRSATSKGVR